MSQKFAPLQCENTSSPGSNKFDNIPTTRFEFAEGSSRLDVVSFVLSSDSSWSSPPRLPIGELHTLGGSTTPQSLECLKNEEGTLQSGSVARRLASLWSVLRKRKVYYGVARWLDGSIARQSL